MSLKLRTDQSINQNPRRPGVVGYPRQMPPPWWPAIDACPLQRGAIMTSTCKNLYRNEILGGLARQWHSSIFLSVVRIGSSWNLTSDCCQLTLLRRYFTELLHLVVGGASVLFLSVIGAAWPRCVYSTDVAPRRAIQRSGPQRSFTVLWLDRSNPQPF